MVVFVYMKYYNKILQTGRYNQEAILEAGRSKIKMPAVFFFLDDDPFPSLVLLSYYLVCLWRMGVLISSSYKISNPIVGPVLMRAL